MATTSHPTWLVPVVVGGWAVLASALSQLYQWRPPGPLFLVFAVATSAAIPTSAAGVLYAASTTAATAALAVVLGRLEVRVVGVAVPTPAPEEAASRIDCRLSVACGMGTLTAGVVATMSGLAHPSWAMVAAVAPLSVAPLGSQVVRGVHRVTGTVAGLALAALLLAAYPLPPVLLIVVVTALQAATELLVARHYGLALVFITPLALLLTQLAERLSAPELLASRLVETVVGVLIGLVAAALLRHRNSGVEHGTTEAAASPAPAPPVPS